jgi:hypothetical protein
MSETPLSDHTVAPARATIPTDDGGAPGWRVGSRATFERLARSRLFRLACAIFLVAAHVVVVAQFGGQHNLPFNKAPGEPPYYHNPMVEGAPYLWDRLLVSRWDSVHYIGLALRGYSTCRPRPVPPDFLESPGQCQLSFFPGYPALAWLASFGTRLAVDWVMLGMSLLASVVFLYLWTHEVMRRALGTRACYLSLLAFNVFPAAFALVTVQTEPLVLVATLGCFIAVQTRRLTLGALLSGLATGIRITGVGVPVAYALAIFALYWSERRRITPGLVLATGARLALSAWGVVVMMAYQYWRFADPLIYLHSHGRAFKHKPSLSSVFFPDPDLIHRSIAAFEHEGVWVAAAMLWLFLGLPKALAGFNLSARFFWVGLTVSSLGIAMPGSVELAYAGMIRYLLLVLPLFFSIAVVAQRSLAVVLLWVALSGWNYYNMSLRFYVLHSPFLTRWSSTLLLPPRPSGAPVAPDLPPLEPVAPDAAALDRPE